MNESELYYVSTRGLLKSCDYYSHKPCTSIDKLYGYKQISISDFDNLGRIPVIHVCTTAFRDFLKQMFPKIPCRFILVTNDGNVCVPYELFESTAEYNKFINNKKLHHWFSENLMVFHPKISKIPIGLDYHTISNNDHEIMGEKMTPHQQEQMIEQIRQNSHPFWARIKKCFANFHFTTYTNEYGINDRQIAIDKLKPELIYYQETPLHRGATWELQSEYAFVISPYGLSIDCHRTWEALILGCIPIVLASKIDNIYEDLPVLIVSKWEDITIDLLMITINNFKDREFNYEKLTLNYWKNIIQNI
jgi:hypothetical protein